MGPVNALKAHALLGAGVLLPVHWGTFSMAMHPWDDPAETLLALAPEQGVHLLMPRLGEPVEPARAELVTPWGRGVERLGCGAQPAEMTLPKSMPWPID